MRRSRRPVVMAEPLDMSLARYVVYDMPGMCDEIDVYVADFADEEYSTLFVVLIPAATGLPPYVHAENLDGLTHEAAIERALETYMALQRLAIACWRRREKSS